ncbi:DUF742 domain-containing protein [Solwaraspora sp. WMMD791]|nr:DUF742 domain-containing protein [Solwaraspora sp. WMMD791]WFE29128.1 DUF742 domain-containing protein [Solwaraspora sp. WMMD791]
MCHAPLAVAEIAAHLDLPLGTVRVLLSDLLGVRGADDPVLELSMIQVRNPSAAGGRTRRRPGRDPRRASDVVTSAGRV